MSQQNSETTVQIEDELLIDESELTKDIAQIENTVSEEIVFD